MMVTWKSFTVTKVSFDSKRDEYHLLDEDDYIVDTIPRTTFLSHPELRNLPNARHRQAPKKNNSRSINPALIGADPGANDQTLFFSRGPAFIARGPRPGPSLANWQSFVIDEVVKPLPPLRREGIIATDLIGYRCWRIENGLLRSVFQDDFWFPSIPLKARGFDDWDSRGIHAWKEPGSKPYNDYIRGYLNPNHDPFVQMIIYGTTQSFKSPAMATGTVLLWGDVVEHELGYRAEFAKVQSIDWLYPDASMMGREAQALQELREIYGV